MVLRSNTQAGHLRLAELLATPAALEPRLREAVVNCVRTDQYNEAFAPTIHQRLFTIAGDTAVALENRHAAVEALGRSGKSAELHIPQLESLAASDPQALGRTVAIAISRLRNTPVPERLVDDLEIARRGDYVGSAIRAIGEFGSAAHDIGPEILKELNPLGDDTGPCAALTIALIGYREGIPELRAALHCPTDWRLVAAAAEALGRLQSKEAEPELALVARNHWEPLVREVAQNAVDSLVGRHEYRKPGQGTDCLEYDRLFIDQLLKAHSEGWYPTKDEIAREERAKRREQLRVAWVRLISPPVRVVTYQSREGTLGREAWRHLPRHRIKFAGGLLLGYDEGEFGAGLIFVSKAGEARAFPMGNVTQLVPWNDGVIALTTEAMIDTSRLYFVRARPDGAPTVAQFMRMPNRTERCTVEASGALNFYGRLRLKTNGELEMLPEHSK